MFLQNWESIQAIKLAGSVETASPTVFGGASRTVKGHNGVISAGVMSWFGDEKVSSSTYYSSAVLCGLKLSGGWTNASGGAAIVAMNPAAGLGPVLAVGSGTSAVNNEDYTLVDITNLTHGSYSYGRLKRFTSGWWEGWIGRTLANSTGASVTVSELGIYLPLYCGNTSSTISMAALVYRELLPAPVVMANGESFTFGLKLRFYGKR
jgi:hypothetical protein